MTSLNLRLWRRCRAARRDGARRCILGAAALAACAALPGAEAAESRSPVTVDLGALDALQPPAQPYSGPTIRLHLPPAPAAKEASRAPPAKSAPAQTAMPAPALPPASANGPPLDVPPPPVQSARMPAQVAERIVFPADGALLPDDAKANLDKLAKRLTADGHLYVQLVGYAGGDGDASLARRLSLSRALAARSYLVGQGVEIKQVDVRPLGNRSEPGLPPDRVDLVVAER